MYTYIEHSSPIFQISGVPYFQRWSQINLRPISIPGRFALRKCSNSFSGSISDRSQFAFELISHLTLDWWGSVLAPQHLVKCNTLHKPERFTSINPTASFEFPLSHYFYHVYFWQRKKFRKTVVTTLLSLLSPPVSPLGEFTSFWRRENAHSGIYGMRTMLRILLGQLQLSILFFLHEELFYFVGRVVEFAPS